MDLLHRPAVEWRPRLHVDRPHIRVTRADEFVVSQLWKIAEEHRGVFFTAEELAQELACDEGAVSASLLASLEWRSSRASNRRGQPLWVSKDTPIRFRERVATVRSYLTW